VKRDARREPLNEASVRGERGGRRLMGRGRGGAETGIDRLGGGVRIHPTFERSGDRPAPIRTGYGEAKEAASLTSPGGGR